MGSCIPLECFATSGSSARQLAEAAQTRLDTWQRCARESSPGMDFGIPMLKQDWILQASSVIVQMVTYHWLPESYFLRVLIMKPCIGVVSEPTQNVLVVTCS